MSAELRSARVVSGGRALVRFLACACASCVQTEVPPNRALIELERLAYVPAAACRLPTGEDFSIQTPIVMDLFELTRGDLDFFRAVQGEGTWRSDDFVWSQEPATRTDSSDWPAFFTFEEALRLADRRGMRLPTAREWMHVALGRRALEYPWGKDQESVANTLETGLGFPTPVGTFENGRSQPFGCYDMVGNVWEWVSSTVPGYLDWVRLDFFWKALHIWWAEQSAAANDLLFLRASVLGGAYNTPRRRTYGPSPERDGPTLFHARLVDPGTISPSIGARMCADAERYLWTMGARWGSGAAVRARVQAVAQRWSQDPLARVQLRDLLERMIAREGAPEGLRWLLEGLDEGGPSG